jgi:3-dehydroquinate dehydratase/shikimate dehydrogenase
VCGVVARLKGKALLLNRDLYRAQELASQYHFETARLDENSVKRMKKYSDLIIQTTSVGGLPDTASDPVPWYQFTGKEYVMDIIYKPAETKFLQRALRANCKAINGEAMLHHQAKSQYQCFFGTKCPVE